MKPKLKESVRVEITPEDIELWKRDPGQEPLLRALQRATHTPWRLVEINMLIEKVAPYRTMILRSEILGRCREHIISSRVVPFAFETELLSAYAD